MVTDLEARVVDKQLDVAARGIKTRIDEAIARILVDADRDVASHRARREAWVERHGGVAPHDQHAAGILVGLVRDRRRKKTL
jgi:hypothetical protein